VRLRFYMANGMGMPSCLLMCLNIDERLSRRVEEQVVVAYNTEYKCIVWIQSVDMSVYKSEIERVE
jgi:hypothetical protein